MNKEQTKRTGFSSKIGVVLAAAGSAIGLGNIWKFPYMAGENGGGAFLIVYLICVLVFGLPLLMTEFLIGKSSGKSAYSAFRTISGNNRWQWLSWWTIIAVYILMGFYFVVTGWCANYLYEALTNGYAGLDATGLELHFNETISSPWRMIIFGWIPIFSTAAVLWFGVHKGIERLSKILMPLLLLMMVGLAIYVMTFDGSREGLRFLFKIDFSQITPEVVMMAVGQCFFSLSVGIGALITYGSYMPKTQDATMTSLQVIILDTLVALLAGVIIFPAVFAFGVDPQEGPELVFVVLPAVFQQMALGRLCGVLFFLLLFIAAITSTVSIMEVAVGNLREMSHEKLTRRHCVLIVTAFATTMMTLCVLSMTGIWSGLSLFGHDLFECSDTLVTNIMMPLGALCMSLFVGWFMPQQDIEVVPQSRKRWKQWLRPALVFALRWVVPTAILLIFLNGLGIFK